MRSFFTALSLVICLSRFGFAEPGFKCYGCLAGPHLMTTTQSDEDCKFGNLERKDQYICKLSNSRKSDTLEFLSAKEIEEIESKAEIKYSFGCVKTTFKSVGNDTDLFTVRGCVYDQYEGFQAVCETEENDLTWLRTFEPNPENPLFNKPIEELLPKNITAERCTCFTDACNASSTLDFSFSSLLILFNFVYTIVKIC